MQVGGWRRLFLGAGFALRLNSTLRSLHACGACRNFRAGALSSSQLKTTLSRSRFVVATGLSGCVGVLACVCACAQDRSVLPFCTRGCGCPAIHCLAVAAHIKAGTSGHRVDRAHAHEQGPCPNLGEVACLTHFLCSCRVLRRPCWQNVQVACVQPNGLRCICSPMACYGCTPSSPLHHLPPAHARASSFPQIQAALSELAEAQLALLAGIMPHHALQFLAMESTAAVGIQTLSVLAVHICLLRLCCAGLLPQAQ